MLTEVTLPFLRAIQENNNTTWMHNNIELYRQERDNFFDFWKKLIAKTAEFEPEIKDLEIKDATFRFNRDIRFSKDKSPYKTNFSLVICEWGKKSEEACYYVHIQPDSSFIWWWMYMISTPTTNNIRNYISKNYKEFNKIINNPEFKKTFWELMWEKLKKVPKQFDPENPAWELLKMKSRYVWHKISDKKILSKNFLDSCIKIFKIIKPLNDFLNKARL